MDKFSKNKNYKSIFLNFIASLLFVSTYALIKFFLGEKVVLSQKIIISLIIIIIISFLLKELIKYYASFYNSETGIIKIYKNFNECEIEILKQIKKSNSSKIFIYVGKTMLSGRGELFSLLREIKFPKDKSIKVLHASKKNEYFSESKAENRYSKSNNIWTIELKNNEEKAKELQMFFKDKLEFRQHKEGFYWRIFLFDEVAYVQPYLYESKNEARAPVYKLINNKTSMYQVFNNYFDNKWNESNKLEL